MKDALSTVGLSAYNVLARSGGPMPSGKLFQVVRTASEDDTLTAQEFGQALDKLLLKKLIRPLNDGVFDVVDPKRRLVRWRDREGDGWSKWQVSSPAGPILLNSSEAN